MSFSNLVEMFRWRVETSASRPALWFKRQERFQSISWQDFFDKVKRTALALHQFGIKRGDRVAILSENRPEWAFADLGILSLGAASVPIYATSSAKECGYILEHSEVTTLFLSNADQLQKVKPLLEQGKLKRLICFDCGTNSGSLLSFADFLERGRRSLFNNGNLYDQLASGVRREDVATLIYTSGTTGPPKGVMLTHGNFLSNCEGSSEALHLKEGEQSLSFLPLSHVFERMAGYYFMILQGASIAYAESMQTVPQDILLIRPTVAASVPRLYEKMYAKIQEAIQSGSSLKQKIFNWALKVGKETAHFRQEHQPLPFGLKLQFSLARLLVFKKLKQHLGGRIRFFISGGAPLSKELAEFFFAADVLILEGYGLTETSPVISVNRVEKFRFGTVGPLLPNVEVQIAADGEILTRGPHIMKGYFKNEAATREAIPDGWFHTGDVGEIDAEGFLKITDRKKDLIITAGGKNISPQNIENELMADPLFSQVVVVGDRRPYIVALIVPSRSQIDRLAEAEDIHGSWESLLKNERVRSLVGERVQEKMKDFAPYEQIKTFHLLSRELTQETGELTPTLKIKRRIVTERYSEVIEAMYRKGEAYVHSGTA